LWEEAVADYSQQIEDLQGAADICMQHTLGAVNKVQPQYPRWPNAWAACETVWREYLEMRTMAADGSDNEDRETIIREAHKFRR
jgi:hypothetical protein